MLLESLIVLIALAGAILLLLGLRRLMRRRLISGGVQGLSGALLVAVALLLGALSLNLYTYQRLTREAPVAEVRFQALGPQRYRVDVLPAGRPPLHFELQGDEWQLDARILKWRGPATLLGFDTVYRLERISGRYASIAAERQGPRSVFGLSEQRGLDLWALAQRHERWLPWVDAIYGSATYMPMADQARFAVSVGQSGLIARPLNAPARAQVQNWR